MNSNTQIYSVPMMIYIMLFWTVAPL